MEDGLLVGGKYRLNAKIGEGSFGTVFLGINESTKDEVAVKVESTQSQCQQLLYEAKILKQLQGGLGVPVLHWSGVVDCWNVMVMEHLGTTLEGLFEHCNCKFSLKSVCQLGHQMLKRLEYVHEQNFVHRDIKPENFMIGKGKKASILHIIDFGLSKKYRDPKTRQHIPYREGRSLMGTARYASINSHLGLELSRRDDLESVGYVLVYLCKGTLPWIGCKGNSKQEQYNNILESKLGVSPAVLCQGCPDILVKYLTYCKGLMFEEKPDYQMLSNLFTETAAEKGFSLGRVFDWTEVESPPAKRRKSVSSRNSGKVSKQKSVCSSRRKSEQVLKESLKDLVRKVTLSEKGSEARSDSSVITLVKASAWPIISKEVRIVICGLNSNPIRLQVGHTKKSCVLF